MARMRIIIDESSDRIERHAMRTIRHLEERQFSRHGDPVPLGVAYHSVHYPEVCDDCGETYWSTSRWTAHPGCKGNKREAGFRPPLG